MQKPILGLMDKVNKPFKVKIIQIEGSKPRVVAVVDTRHGSRIPQFV